MRMKAVLLGLCMLTTNVQAREVSLISPISVKLDPQMACLARNIYHESRGEPFLGQIAVGIVTIQRMKSSHYPDTICEVVYQPHAFSWTSKSDQKEDPKILYGKCLLAAYQAILIRVVDPDWFDADHYHNLSVHPYWADAKTLVAQIGNHKFYK